MSKLVLQAFWEKIKKYFATKLYVATLKSSKQDTLIAGKGIRIVNNVISNSLFPYKHKNEQGEWVIEGSDEKVIVTLFGPTGFNLENRQITLTYYLDNEPVLPARVITKTTDSNGVVIFSSDPETGDGTGVPVGYEYEITFPKIATYLEITPEKHVAGVVERNIEVTYVHLPQPEDDDYGEEITIHLDKFENNEVTPFEGVNVSVKIGTAAATTYTTDANGNTISFKVRYGLSYTVTAPTMTNYYIPGNSFSNDKYSQTYTSEKRNRIINFTYKFIKAGIFIIDNLNNEYTKEEFILARDIDLTIVNDDALLIKIVTSLLAAHNGIFALGIDDTRKRVNSSTQWSSAKVLYVTIPSTIGESNLPKSLYYYNGLAPTKLIREEGRLRGYSNGALTYCLNKQIALQDGTVYYGFLGSTGQWATAMANANLIDEILLEVRPESEKPEGTTYYTFSSFTERKWTSNLGGSINTDTTNNAWLFNTTPESSGGSKTSNWPAFSFYSLTSLI